LLLLMCNSDGQNVRVFGPALPNDIFGTCLSAGGWEVTMDLSERNGSVVQA